MCEGLLDFLDPTTFLIKAYNVIFGAIVFQGFQ